MKIKKLALNTMTSFLYQIVTVICGLVLPRAIIKGFGSEINGMVNSISQFLQVIAFLELGVGAVVQSALYKPLSERNEIKISEIVTSAAKFFRKIAYFLLVYVVGLSVIYPSVIHQTKGYIYTTLLIAAMSISYFAQYFFGIVDRLLLTADQKGYIQYISQTITLIVNTIACLVLIYMGYSIQIVKLVTSLIYLIRPLLLRLYVNRKYKLNRKITYNTEPISQKWNGVAQHIAAIVLDSTDTIVLSIFSSLVNVSIYSTYYFVVNGIKQMFISLISGAEALFGKLWAECKLDELNSFFEWTEWLIHTTATIIWGCTFVLIIPFVKVYIKGINDANYIVPVFAGLITIANAIHSLRLPYNSLILAAGHYKQTQHNYIIAAVINVFISILSVKMFGLIGVAIGTLIAMLYQTIWMMKYDSKYLLKRNMIIVIKQLVTDIVIFVLGVFLTYNISFIEISWLNWIKISVIDVCIWLLISILINTFIYKDRMERLFLKISKSINK